MPEWVDACVAILERVRREQPLIHIITNFVTMNDVANAALAMGARPVMAHALEEVEDVTRLARALVLNLGTPSRERVEAMLHAGQVANACDIPVIFDPVGIGASTFRKESAARVLDSLRLKTMRGNASEIGVLAGMPGTQSGVDAVQANYDRAAVVQSLAEKYRMVIAVTGATDFVSEGASVVTVENGHAQLQKITGAGDMLDAIIGACAAVETEVMPAVVSGLLMFGIAAERAARATSTHGIGSFHSALFDALGNLDADTIRRHARLKEISGG